MEATPFIFDLGTELRDILSGFTGICRGRSQYLTGCNTYGLQSRELNKDGKPADWVWFDEHMLVSTKGKPVVPNASVRAESQPKKGGPTNDNPPQRTA